MTELLARAEVYAESIARGAKPIAEVVTFEMSVGDDAAWETIQDSLRPIKEIAKSYGIRYRNHGVSIGSSVIYSLYFYKNQELLDILIEADERINGSLLHYIRGKLFGYSDSEILDYIKEKKDVE